MCLSHCRKGGGSHFSQRCSVHFIGLLERSWAPVCMKCCVAGLPLHDGPRLRTSPRRSCSRPARSRKPVKEAKLEAKDLVFQARIELEKEQKRSLPRSRMWSGGCLSAKRGWTGKVSLLEKRDQDVLKREQDLLKREEVLSERCSLCTGAQAASRGVGAGGRTHCRRSQAAIDSGDG